MNRRIVFKVCDRRSHGYNVEPKKFNFQLCYNLLKERLCTAGSAILRVFFPKICANCRSVCEEDKPVCFPCYQNVSFIEKPLCVLCSMPLGAAQAAGKCETCNHKPTFVSVVESVFEYNANSQNMILRLKYFDDTTNVGIYAQWMRKKGSALLNAADVVVPVPIHRLRLLSRKYNQSVLLARKISEISSKPLEVFALKKSKSTMPQNSLTAAQRARNVHGSFTVTDSSKFREKVILLIDDVVTTGGTLQACAQALRGVGARDVLALTLGRTLTWPSQNPHHP